MDLLHIQDADIVSKTNLSRKLTLGGVTKAYPVYRVRLDKVFYNDQNDRIATWITQYKNEGNHVPFSELSREEYNQVIEQFIIASNPSAIEKTKNNIALVNQREPGVVLADGRIIDGNRRFTCLRMLQAENPQPYYFETVILDAASEQDKKQIKMLELAIQHGEEQRVDYNLIDLAVGAYHDIVETKLLTINEYAGSTNETIAEVRRRIETAKLIIEFLEFMGVSKQYHIAREMQVFSIFYEMVPLLRRCESEATMDELKKSVFTNTMLGTFADQRKYIRDVKALMDTGFYVTYMMQQNEIVEEMLEKKAEQPIHNQIELRQFVKNNRGLSEKLDISMENALRKLKKAKTKGKPSQVASKSLALLMDIDIGIVEKLHETEKEKLCILLQRITDVAAAIKEEVASEFKG